MRPNAAARCWLAEVNSRPHSETKRPPVEPLAAERPLLRALPALRPAVACGEQRKVDRLATVRFASARYSVPHRLVGRTVRLQASDRELTVLADGVPVSHHPLLGPASARSRTPTTRAHRRRARRALRPRTEPERAFLALGEEAERYLRTAAGQGTARLHERIDEALSLAVTRGEERARRALERASEFRRFARGDPEAICDALGATPPAQALPAEPLHLAGLPDVPTRSLEAYRRDGQAA